MASLRLKNPADSSLVQELSRLLHAVLLADLQQQTLERGVEESLRRRHAQERAAGLTTAAFEVWKDEEYLLQVGAAWILSCVALRILEDRGLLGLRRLCGPGARDAEQRLFEQFPALSARDYLLMVFREVSRLPGGELLGPEQNLAFHLPPSAHGAAALLEFFRQTGEDGVPRYRFDRWHTRLLGDLYQHLSAPLRERRGLVQTPDFVVQFILDLTLQPAIQRFVLEEVKVIDPACGAGGFLLGAYARMCDESMLRTPGRDRREAALQALQQIYGADIDPYSVAIARFRLTLAYLEQAGLSQLSQAPRLPLNLTAADSLLQKGPAGKYHVVVGDPPCVTCKDAALREEYRQRYESASSNYSLAAPFTELAFNLAADDGYVGLLTASTFTKREFGRRLIEGVLPRHDLTRVIDLSGAYIPGHGTPTLLLFGRGRRPVKETVRAVLGKRGEPITPTDPEAGLVWRSIAAHHNQTAYEDDFIAVRDIPRSRLSRHPWSLGADAGELREILESRAPQRLGARVDWIGHMATSGKDDVFLLREDTFRTLGLEPEVGREAIAGDMIRDWAVHGDGIGLCPYDRQTQQPLPWNAQARWTRFLWPHRSVLKSRAIRGRSVHQLGRAFWEWSQWSGRRAPASHSLAYTLVAADNHFVLLGGGEVCLRSAPVLSLSDSTPAGELALLGYLNSSLACFWLKQVSFSKQRPSSPETGAAEWYEFSMAGLRDLPLPSALTQAHPLRERIASLADGLQRLARQRQECAPGRVITDAVAKEPGELLFALSCAQQRDVELRQRMICDQEDLDWACYALFGLAPATPARTAGQALPEHRPFTWLQDEAPDEMDPNLVGPWTARRQLLMTSPSLCQVEIRAYKRAWQQEDFAELTRDACRTWILRRMEQELRIAGVILSVEKLAKLMSSAADVRAVCEVYQGRVDIRLSHLLEQLGRAEGVPYLATLRYRASGIEKRRRWEAVWERQRQEDAGPQDGMIEPVEVPPPYTSRDFRDPALWGMRGRLDVPRERFILYPGLERDSDKAPLLGWAGWDHAARARALMKLFFDRRTLDGWGPDRLRPLLEGMRELLPWVRQWHNEPSPDFDGERPGDCLERFIENESPALGIPAADSAC